jgi:hypothetical protein
MMKLRALLLIAFLSISSLVFGQDATKNQIFSLDDFSGGLNTQLSPESLPGKYAVICESVRLDSSLKELVKRPLIYLYGTTSPSEAITGMHRLYLKDGTKVLIVNHGSQIDTGNDTTGAFTEILALTSGNHRWQWLTFNNVGIGTDGYNQPVKYDGSSASATYLGTALATADAVAGNPNGTYTYKISYYSASYEILFNVVSNPVTVSSKKIDLSMIPIAPTTYLTENVVGRKVYRIANGGVIWKLLSNGTIADNSTTTLLDNDADGTLGADYPAGNATYTPPKGRLCIINRNRVFIANDPNYPSRMYWSEDGLPDVFITGHYWNFRPDDGDEITMLKQLYGQFIVGKTNTIQYFNTDDADWSNWVATDPYTFVGCVGMYTSANTPLGILYLGKDGLYNFSGTYSKLISYAVNSVDEDISPSNIANTWGEFNNNTYYLAYSSKTVGGSVNNRVLVYDLLSDAYEIDTVGINCFTSFSGGSDGGLLYAGSSSLGNIYSFQLASQSIVHSISTDFSGTFTNSRIIPPEAGGDLSNPIIELAWDVTIDGYGAGTIDAATGIIDRPTTTGSYISQVLSTPNIVSYDKLFWNSVLPAGTTATFAVRSGATAAACAVAAWSAEFSNAAGSDISAVGSGAYTQYRISLATGDIAITPTIIKSGGFDVKLTYNTLGYAYDTSIPLHWQSGFFDMGAPVNDKSLTKFSMVHEGTTGIITVKITNELGIFQTFSVDLSTNPETYEGYFDGGLLRGRRFNVDITNSDLNPLTVKQIRIIYNVEPLT